MVRVRGKVGVRIVSRVNGRGRVGFRISAKVNPKLILFLGLLVPNHSVTSTWTPSMPGR